MTKNTANCVRKIISRNLNVEFERVIDGALLIEDLQADSLDVVEIVMRIEEKFGIEIPDDEMDAVRTVADAVKCAEQRVGA